MKFNDLKYQNKIDPLVDVFDSGVYLFGEKLKELEEKFPKSIGMRNGVGVKNATDGLYLVLKFLYDCGYENIFLPNFTANATAVAARNVTDNLYYVDVDKSFTIDVDRIPIFRKSVVVAVNLFGNNANLEKLRRLCDYHDSVLVEDCAQSTGSELKERVSDYAIYSFYPTKPLGSMGDGGMICSGNFDLGYFDSMRFMGQDDMGMCWRVGINSRLDEFQSAVILSKMNIYRGWNLMRQMIAERYKKIVRGIHVHTNCVYHQFPLLLSNRDLAIKMLNERGIPYMIHYPYHITDQEVLAGKNKHEVGFRINDKILSLPIHACMIESEIQQVEEFLNDIKQDEIL